MSGWSGPLTGPSLVESGPAPALFGELEPTGRVLVVDDEPKNRELLRELLLSHHYEVFEAADGVEGLAVARARAPDTILLDVMMPRLDGFEVCRQLKAAPDTAVIPVLIVTSLSARQERLQAIQAGANDFVTKPIDTADLLLRVRNAVRAKHLFNRLEEQYRRLQTLEHLRDSLVHMIIHDLRSPLGAAAAYLQLLEADPLNQAQQECVTEARTLIAQIVGMANAVLDVNRLESGRMPVARTETDVGPLVHEALQTLGPAALRRVRFAPPPEPAVACCDAELITRVLLNLVGNALKFSEGDQMVTVHLAANAHTVRVAVTDTGPGIAPEDRHRIFEKFGQAGTPTRRGHHAAGLGLTFCKMAVEAHGGEIDVVSAPGQGSTFWFQLPRAPAGTEPSP